MNSPQRAMRRISPNNPVRRRLFPELDPAEEARADNWSNVLQESIARDKAEMSKKYNFNFEDETPLPGQIEWFKREGENWIGFNDNDNTKVCDDENSYQLRMENETTPNEKTGKEAPEVRKRKTEALSVDNRVKRKICYD